MIPFDKLLSQLLHVHQLKNKIKAIIISDPGVDDALMLLQILSHSIFDISGIIPIEGNASYQTTLENSLNLCEYIKRKDINIYPCTSYFTEKPIQTNIAPIYGKNGLNNLNLPKAKYLKPAIISGEEFAVKALSEKHLIISTGPLTELSKILITLKNDYPKRLNNIIGISIMGGVINHTQEANWPVSGVRITEANIAYDPVATKHVFNIAEKYKIPIFLSPLDLTQTILASKDDVKDIPNTRITKLAKKLIVYTPFHYQMRYRKGPNNQFRQPIHDIHASNCILNPEIYHAYLTSIRLEDGRNNLIMQTNNRKRIKNVALLDMHYSHRKRFFETLFSNCSHHY